MPRPKLFQKMANAITNRRQEDLPPTYSEATNPNPFSSQSARIDLQTTANAVPQWKWDTFQCRAWLRAFFVIYFGLDPEEAYPLAQTFEGPGLQLYLKTLDEWTKMLVNDQATSIHTILSLMRYKRGALPDRHYIHDDGRLIRS